MNDEITPPDHKNNEEKVTKVRNLADLQRMKLEKLMKNPDKPVIIPEKPKTKNVPPVPDFVRNVMGSSAGAGSGEFHVYRHLRRKEYARQKFIQEMSKREQLEFEYQEKLENNRRLAEEKTAKKRAKRLKKKAKMKNKKRKTNNQQQKIEKSDSESESDSGNEGTDEETEKLEKQDENKVRGESEEHEKQESKEESENKVSNKTEAPSNSMEEKEVASTESDNVKSVHNTISKVEKTSNEPKVEENLPESKNEIEVE
ncbi:PRKR-interacting protein 1 homolog [Chrysoperla carnea]|uniref:PRKR-interacting protein 1 homolog n=1 Tax=Chrysoperla carnea TaxID=189513 RepID=UPI001D06E136|nr:PRKR-interacting protein 1 homolog [Chrysoperla carnea]